MGSRFALAFLLVAALAASTLFWWLSSRDSDGRGAPARSGPAEEVAAPSGEPTPAELVTPETVADQAAEPDERTIVDQPRNASRTERREREASGPRLAGRVVDREGNGIAAASVLASNHTGLTFDLELEDTPWTKRFEATTDANGRFELVGPKAGQLHLAVRATGYAPYDKTDLSIPGDPQVELAPVVMSPGAILSGRVIDPDGRGVPGAELVRLDPAEQAGFLVFDGRRKAVAETNADGAFRVDQLACGPWRIQVRTEDHPDRTFEGIAEDPGAEVSGLVFVLEPGETIEGRVVDVPAEEKGELTVRASKAGDEGWLPGSSRSGEVDASGRFTIRGLEVGERYDLRARRNAEGDRFAGYWGRSRSESVRARAGDTGVVIPYVPEAAVLFQVVDSLTREPVTGFEVEAGIGWTTQVMGEDGKPLRSHPEGRVRIGNLRPANDDERVQFLVRATGYREYHRDGISVTIGQELDLGQVLLEPVPVVRVTVLDSLTGAPVPGALVTLDEERPEGGHSFTRTIEIDSEDGMESHFSTGGMIERTDADGVAELTSLEGKTCVLRVRSKEHAPQRLQGLFLPVGQVVEQTVELTPGGSVVVTVLDPDGEPMPGARVAHRSPEQGSGPMVDLAPTRALVTDSTGELVFHNLAPGLHGFQIKEGGAPGGMFVSGGDVHLAFAGEGGDDGEEWTEVEIAEGGTSEVLLQASPRGTLVGVVREAGELLAGASLTLSEKKEGEEQQGGMRMMPGMGMGGGKRARSDGEGAYGFDDVKEGLYTLKIEHPTRRMADEYVVEIEEGETEFDVDLPVSILEGRITDSDGQPLTGLKVSAELAQEGGEQMGFFAIRIESDGDDTVVSTGQELGDSTTTDQDGYYLLRGVQPDVELVVVAEGQDVQRGRSEPLTVLPDEVRTGVDLELQPAGSVEVEALLADGSPATFCLVRATYTGGDAEGVEPKVAFIQNRSTKLSGMRPGLWTINVRKAGPGRVDGDGGIDQDVEVRAGETVPTTIRMD